MRLYESPRWEASWAKEWLPDPQNRQSSPARRDPSDENRGTHGNGSSSPPCQGFETRRGRKLVLLWEGGHVNDFFRSAILFSPAGWAGRWHRHPAAAPCPSGDCAGETQPVCRKAPPRAPDTAVKHPWYFSLRPAAQLGAFGRAQTAAFPSRVLLLPVRSQGPNGPSLWVPDGSYCINTFFISFNHLSNNVKWAFLSHVTDEVACSTQLGRPGKSSEKGIDLRVLNGSLLVHSATLPDKLWLSSDPDDERVRITAEDRRDFLAASLGRNAGKGSARGALLQ